MKWFGKENIHRSSKKWKGINDICDHCRSFCYSLVYFICTHDHYCFDTYDSVFRSGYLPTSKKLRDWSYPTTIGGYMCLSQVKAHIKKVIFYSSLFIHKGEEPDISVIFRGIRNIIKGNETDTYDDGINVYFKKRMGRYINLSKVYRYTFGRYILYVIQKTS